MAVLLAPHDDAVVGGQALLETHAHAQADDGGERAVGDGRGDVDAHLDDGVGGGRRAEGRGGRDVDVGQVDDGELAEGDRVLGIGDGGYEICIPSTCQPSNPTNREGAQPYRKSPARQWRPGLRGHPRDPRYPSPKASRGKTRHSPRAAALGD